MQNRNNSHHTENNNNDCYNKKDVYDAPSITTRSYFTQIRHDASRPRVRPYSGLVFAAHSNQSTTSHPRCQQSRRCTSKNGFETAEAKEANKQERKKECQPTAPDETVYKWRSDLYGHRMRVKSINVAKPKSKKNKKEGKKRLVILRALRCAERNAWVC